MVRTNALALIIGLVGVASVSAHQEPKTDTEIETQRALQRAAYYVRRIDRSHLSS